MTGGDQRQAATIVRTDRFESSSDSRWWLIGIGAVMVALAVTMAIVGYRVGSRTTVEPTRGRTPTTTSTSTSTTTTTTAQSGGGATATSSPGSGSSSSSASTALPVTTTTQTAFSDTLLLAILGTGAVLLLTGFFYNRVSTIKLPGGAELDLSPIEAKAVSDAVAAHVTSKQVKPAQTAQITRVALDIARQEKQTRGGLLSQSDLGPIVSKAVAEAAQPSTPPAEPA